MILVNLAHALGDRAVAVLDRLVKRRQLRIELGATFHRENVVGHFCFGIVQLFFERIESAVQRLRQLVQQLIFAIIRPRFLLHAQLLANEAQGNHRFRYLRDVVAQPQRELMLFG